MVVIQEVLTGYHYVPGSARLMKIMAKDVTNRVTTIKLPDGQWTQTGRETPKDLLRVYFPKMIQMMDRGSRTWRYADAEQGRLKPGQECNKSI
jgi:hypothetical protein